jgi:hypothetical protein
MFQENCVERRKHNEEEYASVEEYVNNGSNLAFLRKEYMKFLNSPQNILK